MHALRPARLEDLHAAARWVGSPEDARPWAGARLSFPVDEATLAADLEFGTAESWALSRGERLMAFGQLVPKPGGRRHLARLIVDPTSRGAGLGRILSERLLARARESASGPISLNVDAGNAAALSLYRSLGFEEAPRPPDEPASLSVYMQLGERASAG